ncbi:MAG: hypothetical protein ACRDEB_01335, partial [Chitinophagaceae bacterium]
GKLVMFDNREEKIIDGTKLGFNGYALLKLREHELRIEYYDRVNYLFKETWNADNNSGNILGSMEIPPECTLKPEDGKNWEDACRE